MSLGPCTRLAILRKIGIHLCRICGYDIYLKIESDTRNFNISRVDKWLSIIYSPDREACLISGLRGVRNTVLNETTSMTFIYS